MVFQNYALFPHLTVFENVAFGLKMKRTPEALLRKKVREVLEMVQLSDLAERYPQQLSGGQQQRVALARAIVNEPGVLLLDEPLAALDKNLRLAMQVELRKLQRSLGITFLHVTHDQSEALTLADRVLIMRAGKIEQVGEPDEVYNRPRNRFVAEFLGNANILTGDWSAAKGIAILSSNRQLVIKNDSLPKNDCAAAEMMIRPERIQIIKNRQTLPAQNCFPADVANVVYAGAETYCQLRAGEWELLVQQLNQQDETVRVGEQVYVYFPPESIVFLDGGIHKGASH
jgi:spermidine/putrescine transport system ATP-binding protein